MTACTATLCREGDTRRVCGEPREAHVCDWCLTLPVHPQAACLRCRGTGLALGHEYRPEEAAT